MYKVTCIKQPPVNKGPQKCWSHGNYIRSVSLYAISQLSGSITVSPHSSGGLRLQLTRFVSNISIAVVWQPSSGKTNKQTTTATMQLFGNLHQSKQTNNNSNNAVVWQPSSGKTNKNNADNNQWILRQLT